MLPHLLKMVWNRKRSNFLIILEIFFAFLVVFAVLAEAIVCLDWYRRPLGFDARDVWCVGVTLSVDELMSRWSPADADRFEQLMREAEALEPVSGAAVASNCPYSGTTVGNEFRYEGRDIMSETASVADSFREVLGIELMEGRWFEPADAALEWEPVVINRILAQALYGEEDPIGRRMQDESSGPDLRVIGVVRDFRPGGELSRPGSYYFRRALTDAEGSEPLRYLVLKVAPGTSAEFEEPLSERLQAIAPDWSFTFRTLEAQRGDHFRLTLGPLLLNAVVGGFLLLMVVLGLTGVMWQHVTRRTREFGLRRAMGAGRNQIRRQLVAEVMLMAAFGLLLGALVVVQVTMVGPFSFLSPDVVMSALFSAGLLMLLLAGSCGLYPAWAATRIQPAEALHYE